MRLYVRVKEDINMSVFLKVEATYSQVFYLLVLFIKYCFLKAVWCDGQGTPGEKYVK